MGLVCAAEKRGRGKEAVPAHSSPDRLGDQIGAILERGGRVAMDLRRGATDERGHRFREGMAEAERRGVSCAEREGKWGEGSCEACARESDRVFWRVGEWRRE
jgi:hypothetical protein